MRELHARTNRAGGWKPLLFSVDAGQRLPLGMAGFCRNPSLLRQVRHEAFVFFGRDNKMRSIQVQLSELTGQGRRSKKEVRAGLPVYRRFSMATAAHSARTEEV